MSPKLVPFQDAGEVVLGIRKASFGDSNPLWQNIRECLDPDEKLCAIWGGVTIEDMVVRLGGVLVVSNRALRYFRRNAYKRRVKPQADVPLNQITGLHLTRIAGDVKVSTRAPHSSFKLSSGSVDHSARSILDIIEYAMSPYDAGSTSRRFVPLTVSGYPIDRGQLLQVSVEKTGLRLSQGGSLNVLLTFSEIESVEVGGSGLNVDQRGGGIIGGGFGLSGFVIGAASAALINQLTTRTSVSVETILRITTTTGEINLFTSEVLPAKLEEDLMDVRSAIRQAKRGALPLEAGPTLVDQLSQLQKLRDSGALSEQEFAAAKARLLAN